MAAFVLLTVTLVVGAAADEWSTWKSEYGKVYNGEEDEDQRYQIFTENLDYIKAFNIQDENITLELNMFSDLTSQEFEETHMGYLEPDARGIPQFPDDFPLVSHSSSVDWTKHGAVTPVKHQGGCGSCWAFSAIAGLEGVNFLSTGKLVSLSEQQLTDCVSSDYHCHGCHGGNLGDAYDWTLKHHICTESSYSYTGKDGGSCHSHCSIGIHLGHIIGHASVGSKSEPASDAKMMSALTKSPVPVCIYAKDNFKHYKSGVFEAKNCGVKHGHCVLMVAYAHSSTYGDYWKIKNSWGSGWGEHGFVRLKRYGTHEPNNGAGTCGVLAGGTVPKLRSSIVV